MRTDIYSKISIKVILISIMIFLISNILTLTVTAQEKQLKIIVDDIIQANKPFSVTVTDNDSGIGVEDITVFISGSDKPSSKTNEYGVAYLTAPSDPRDWMIVAEDGSGVYKKATYPIKVVAEPGFWESPYFPIAVAIICLIGAIVFVNLKQKKDIYNRADEISKEKLMEKQGIKEKKTSSSSNRKGLKVETTLESKPYELEPVRAKPTEDPKVEEIRISRPRKEKEIIPVKEKDKAEKVISEKRIKKREYDWFEGTDDARYEIDKITGEIDEEGIDKWFEGVDHLKDKIDEKVKKKDKKKNKSEQEEEN